MEIKMADEDELEMEEDETITRMKNQKSSLFRSFKHKLQKTLLCSHNNKAHKVRSLDLRPRIPPPYSVIDQNKNRVKNEKKRFHPLPPTTDQEYHESMRQSEGHCFYNYSVEPSYQARSCYVPKEYSQSEPRLRVRPYSCSDAFIHKRVTFDDEDVTRVRLNFDATDFSGDDLFCRPPDYSTSDWTDYFESLKRRERMIKSRSDDNLHFLSRSRNRSNDKPISENILDEVRSNSMTSLSSLSGIDGSLPDNSMDNKKTFNYVRFSNDIQSTDDVTEDNTSTTSGLETFRGVGLQYESDRSTLIYETSDDERDHFGRTNSFDCCLLESNIFDEFDAIAESMASAKNRYSSLLSGKYMEKMEAINESESEQARCLHPLPVSFAGRDNGGVSTAIGGESTMGRQEKIIESDCEEIFHSKSFEENLLESQELLKAPITTNLISDVVERECKKEKDPMPDISSSSHQNGVKREYEEYKDLPLPSRFSIKVSSKKSVTSCATPAQNDFAFRNENNNKSTQVKSSLSHELFLNRKKEISSANKLSNHIQICKRPRILIRSNDAEIESKPSLKLRVQGTGQQESDPAEWTNTGRVKPIKRFNSSESSYENQFNFNLADFQRIFCGMRVVSDECILLNTGPVTITHPYTNKYKMTLDAQALKNTPKSEMKSIAISVKQKQTTNRAPKLKRSWFYRTYCIYDLTKSEKRICSSIHFKLENGKRVQRLTNLTTDDINENIKENDSTDLIKIQYTY